MVTNGEREAGRGNIGVEGGKKGKKPAHSTVLEGLVLPGAKEASLRLGGGHQRVPVCVFGFVGFAQCTARVPCR